MPFRVSFRFSVQQDLLGGWGENFWWGGNDQSLCKAASLDLQKQLWTLHGAQVVSSGFRISDPTKFRLVKTVSNPILPVDPVASTDVDYVTTAVQLKLLGADGRTTTQWIRGLPDSATSKGGRFTPSGTLKGNFIKLFNMLHDNGWVLRGLPRPQLQKIVKNVDQATGTITIPNHTFVVGADNQASIRISRVKGLVLLNRVWKVTVVDPNTVTINGWTAIAPPQTISLVSAIAAQQTYVYTAIAGPPSATQDGSDTGHATSHKTGKPSGLLGGRRRRRAS